VNMRPLELKHYIGSPLLARYRVEFLAYLNDIFDPLLNALSDPSDAVSFFKSLPNCHVCFEYLKLHVVSCWLADIILLFVYAVIYS